MKKLYVVLIASFIAIAFYSACRKFESNRSSDAIANYEVSLIKAAQQAFNKDVSDNATSQIITNSVQNNFNSRKNSKKTPVWDKAFTIDFLLGKAVVVPLIYDMNMVLSSNLDNKRVYFINNVAMLLIYKSKEQKYHEEIITLSPDSNYSGKRNSAFSGIITVEDWVGNFLEEYKYDGDRTQKMDTLPSSQVSVSKTTVNSTLSVPTTEINASIIQVCYTLTEYNYSVDDPDGGVYSSEPLGCETYFFNDQPSLGGGPSGGDYGAVGGGSGASNTLSISGGNNIIGNIQDYDKCFTNVAGSGHAYQVTVCVDQPKPDTREAWGFSTSGAEGSTFGLNPVNVGHTFLVFTETSGSGTITRNIGFYPQSTVNPWSPTDQGQLNNDAGHSYNISLTLNITNSQFFNMLDYAALGNNVGFEYNLNSDNCTTFALRTLDAGNVYLPSTVGSWINGSGNDPGDLGEDIRSMSLSSYMTRSTSDVSHPNLGSCL